MATRVDQASAHHGTECLDMHSTSSFPYAAGLHVASRPLGSNCAGGGGYDHLKAHAGDPTPQTHTMQQKYEGLNCVTYDRLPAVHCLATEHTPGCPVTWSTFLCTLIFFYFLIENHDSCATGSLRASLDIVDRPACEPRP